MDSLGIYRMSGKVEEITLVKDSFNSGHDPKLNNFQDINAITGALKSFLRSLPTPLIHGECYTNLMEEVKSSKNTKKQCIVGTPWIKETSLLKN